HDALPIFVTLIRNTPRGQMQPSLKKMSKIISCRTTSIKTTITTTTGITTSTTGTTARGTATVGTLRVGTTGTIPITVIMATTGAIHGMIPSTILIGVVALTVMPITTGPDLMPTMVAVHGVTAGA